jgi:Cd2+/Zn2+-exporting ATPase
VDDHQVIIGNPRYIQEFGCPDLSRVMPEVERLQAGGNTVVLVASLGPGRGARVLGLIAFADEPRPDAADVVRELKAVGVRHVVMLTGDNDTTARHVAAHVGVDAFHANLLPEDKVRLIASLRAEHGMVAMVGDGVNDAPALASADVGIAMGAAGTDVALETADVVLMGDDLHNIPYVVDLSRQTRKTLITNLGFALTMIVIMIGGTLAYAMPLPLAVVGHEGGTVLVSLNGLRLLLYRRRSRATRRSPDERLPVAA